MQTRIYVKSAIHGFQIFDELKECLDVSTVKPSWFGNLILGFLIIANESVCSALTGSPSTSLSSRADLLSDVFNMCTMHHSRSIHYEDCG